MKKYLFCALLISAGLLPVNALSPDKTTASGPLYGKCMHIPYLIYFHFPGFSAAQGKPFQTELGIVTYYTNDYAGYKKTVLGEEQHFKIRDYENLTEEINISLFLSPRIQVGAAVRFLLYYGGFLDGVIEAFHSLFHFRNGGREYFSRGDVYVNIENNNNVPLNLDKSCFAFGDTDLWLKYGFFERKKISLAVAAGLKLPTGRMSGIDIISSGYPDMAVSLLADFHPFRIWSFYVQGGVTFPFDSFLPGTPSDPKPFFNGLTAVEFHPWKKTSVIFQFNIKSSPLSGDLNHYAIKYTDTLSLPQINLLAGMIFSGEYGRWQFYFEEDTFTNQGCDITFNIMYSYRFIPRTEEFEKTP